MVMRRLVQPKLMDVERPMGPNPPCIGVDWTKWNPQTVGDEPCEEDPIQKAALEWYAGAELELRAIFGMGDDRVAMPYLGLGLPRATVEEGAEHRFKHTQDGLGLIGHRLAWAARAFQLVGTHAKELLYFGIDMVVEHGAAGALSRHKRIVRIVKSRGLAGICGHVVPGWQNGSGRASIGKHGNEAKLPWQYDVLFRISARAAAYSNERQSITAYADEGEYVEKFKAACKALARLGRPTHGRPAIIDQWCVGQGGEFLREFGPWRDQVDAAVLEVSGLRRRRDLREISRWVARATLATSHRAT